MKRIIDRPILLVVVFGLAVLAAMYGPWGVAPALAYDPASIEIQIDDDQTASGSVDNGVISVIDVTKPGVIRCEIATDVCTGNISLEYRDGDRLVKMDLTFVALDLNGNESLVITMGDYRVTNYSIVNDSSEQTTGTFRATFTDNRDGTLGVMIEFPNGEQSHTETITFHLSAGVYIY